MNLIVPEIDKFEFALKTILTWDDLFIGEKYWGIYGGEFMVSWKGHLAINAPSRGKQEKGI